MLYSKRVFVAPGDGEGDVGWWVPQWIGNRETNVLEGQQYPLRGFYLPNDEEALDYYALRRMETNHPVIGRLPIQSKSSGSTEASPHEPLNTGSARSKMGNFRLRCREHRRRTRCGRIGRLWRRKCFHPAAKHLCIRAC